jgi:hypothetical protein
LWGNLHRGVVAHGGYGAVSTITTLQRLNAERFLSRVMSLLALAIIGLVPASHTLSVL